MRKLANVRSDQQGTNQNTLSFLISLIVMKAFENYCVLLLAWSAVIALAGASKVGLRRSTPRDSDVESPPRVLNLLWEQITYDDFESGWGSYTDGGSDDALRLSSLTYSHQGSYSAGIRDNTGSQSSIYHKENQDLSRYSDLRLTFWFYSRRMENGKDFFVEYSTDDGSNWAVAQQYVAGVDFENNQFYLNSWEFKTDLGIDVESLAQIKLRFRADGEVNDGEIRLDEILLEGLVTPMTKTLTRDDVCPLDRFYPPQKYEILAFTDKNLLDNVEDDLSEISSLAFSSQTTDAQGSKYAYVVSDKNQFSLKLIKFTNDPVTSNFLTGSAKTVAVYTLNVAHHNDDWEDISLGPCTDSAIGSAYSVDETCIYVGNFGNNNRGNGYVQRDFLEIFKFPEPFFDANSLPQDKTLDVVTIVYRYATPFNQARKFDAEAMFVDWTGANGVGKGDIYIVSKGNCGEGVGQIPISFHKNVAVGVTTTTYDMPPVSSTLIDPPHQGEIACGDGLFRVWQGADMRRDGKLIAMITGAPPQVYFYPRLAGQTVVEAFANVLPSSCPYIASTSYGLANEKKQEAVAFVDAQGTRFAETSECQGGRACNVPIYFYDLIYPETPDSSPDIPTDGWNTITTDDFETGDNWGNYAVGDSKPSRQRSFLSQAYTSNILTGAMHVNLHNGVSSSFAHYRDQDCSSYSMLRVTFQFQMDGFDHMDTLFLELSLDSGQNYYISSNWARDVNGVTTNRVSYDGSVFMAAKDFGDRVTFGTHVRLRFRTSANAENNPVYVDNVLFEGHA